MQKSEIPPSKFWQISGDWVELGIPNLAQVSLIKEKVTKWCKMPGLQLVPFLSY